ncbi:MAG: DUF1700 domain-containing protein [Clostridia bacterium]|nr:DUF1700 domain-containing protein [Clostridia bacterium]
MTKQDFIAELRARLSGLPRRDIEERIDFYIEMIDDRMEDGQTEEEAVAGIGTLDEISSQIISDIPFLKIAKEKVKSKRRLRVWEVVLLALGSPIWLSLGIAAVAVILSVYVVLWSAIISLWAIFASLVACALGGTVAGVLFAVMGNALPGIATVGAGIFCTGASIFFFFCCKVATKGIIRLTGIIALSIKKCFIRKEGA